MGKVTICKVCSQEFELRRPGVVNKYCSRKCYWTWMKGKQPKSVLPVLWGNKNPWWKEEPSYSAIHHWLKRNYGKAAYCESCLSESKRFEWALKKGFKYEKKRENFWQLCTSCHHAYDESRRKMWVTRNG